MNKKIIAAVVAGGLVAGLGGAVVYTKGQISQREAKVVEQMAKLNKFLPVNVLSKNEFTSGLFQSHGVYKLAQMRDAKEVSSITTTYQLKHGLNAWLGGDIEVETKSKSAGEISQEIKTLVDYIAIGKGKIYKDGSFELRQDSPEMFGHAVNEDSSEEVELKIAPSSSVIKYLAGPENIEIELNYPKLLGSVSGKDAPKMELDVSGVKLVRKFSTKAPELGEFSLKLASAKNKMVNVSDLDLSAVISFVQNKYNVKSSIKVGRLDIAMLKNIGFEFSYSLNSIDAVAGEAVKGLYARLKAGQEISESDKKEFKESIRLAAQKGAKINLDKLRIKTPSGFIDINSTLEVKPVGKVEEVYFEDNAKLSAKIAVEGVLANSATNIATAQFGERAGSLSSNNKFSLNLLYDNNQLLANGFEAKSGASVILRQFLRNIDEALAAKRDLPALTSLGEDVNSGVESSAQINKEVDAALASGSKAKKPN